jgi:ATP-dependent helicase/nuclease subunit A
VLDERQTRPTELTVLDRVFGEHHAGDGPLDHAVQSLIREQGYGKDDAIRRLVLKLHRFTRTLANPTAWIAQQTARFNEREPKDWRPWLLKGFVEWRQLWSPTLKSLESTPNVAACCKALAGMSAKPGCAEMREALGTIGEAYQLEWPRGAKTTVREAVKEFFEGAEFLHSLVVTDDSNDPLAEDWGWIRQPMLALLELTREFTDEFTRAKRELGGVDFADLEQLSLQILRDPRTGEPTRAAEAWRQKFRYVFVDEYQDINAAQDAILTLLSRSGTPGNRFLVGDVKQSIYRFRLADPRIFRDYERRWRDAAGDGKYVPLSDNFRSREALLEFINPVFRTLMRPVAGGVAYDEEAELRFASLRERTHLSLTATGQTKNNPVSPRVEFHLLPKHGAAANAGDEGYGNDEDDLDAVEREAHLVAHRLRQLREEKHLVWDETVFRPVEWRDMVVLMRAVESRAERFAKEFSRAGVPLLAARAGFYSALEVTDLLNLLRLLDNPLQDVPLLAVLRSPLVGLSVPEMAQLRGQSSAKPFWAALRQVNEKAGSGERTVAGKPLDAGELTAGTLSRVDLFLKSFERWRRIIRQSSLSHCLEAVLVETHYEALLLAEERGLERTANVHRLLDLARQFDPYQRQGLYRFLRFVETQEEAELDQDPATTPTEDAVRLMTIHKSKGLEWPVVVVAGLGTQFNLKDLNEDILLDEEFGLCPKVKVPDSDQVYPSLVHWLAAGRAKRELLGEELRLLYVALTRSRDTLILTGTARRKNDGEPWQSFASGAVNDQDVLAARSSLDWLRLCLPQITQSADWLNEREGQSRLLRWKIYPEADLTSLGPTKRAATDPSLETKSVDEAELSEVIRRISWQYPFKPATTETAKTSVSALRLRLLEETDAEARPLFQGGWRRRTGELSAAEVGTANHVFLQMVQMERTDNRQDLQMEAERLCRAAVLSDAEVAALNVDGLLTFWRSDLGRRICAQPPQNVHREMPFTARMSAADLAALNLCANADLADNEFVVVQGYVDLAVISPKEIWVVDFKTDDVHPRELEARRANYARQLKLYALALSRIYRRPVTESWLHFLTPGETRAV